MKGNSKPKVLILGASGGCGSWVVRLAVERGYHVTALLRENTKIVTTSFATIKYGDVLSPDTLDEALSDQEIVISCLGLRRKNPRNPWSALLSPPNLTSRVIENLIPLMNKHNVCRLMVISAAGVAESFNQLSWPIKRLVTSGKIGLAYKDLEKMESMLKNSDLDWMAVRPVTLTDGTPIGHVGVVNNYNLFSQIRRSDVATWMLDTLEKKNEFKLRHPLIGTIK